MKIREDASLHILKAVRVTGGGACLQSWHEMPRQEDHQHELHIDTKDKMGSVYICMRLFNRKEKKVKKVARVLKTT